MNIKREARGKMALSAVAFVLVTATLLFANKSFPAHSAAEGIDYFKGNWKVRVKGNARQYFNWSVRDDLRGEWMSGVVELEGMRVSTDFWRRIDGKIERFAFVGDGSFVRLESTGWDSNRLVLAGVASDKRGETRIRETITKVSDDEFRALWERQDSEGRWTTFSEETCTRSKP